MTASRNRIWMNCSIIGKANSLFHVLKSLKAWLKSVKIAPYSCFHVSCSELWVCFGCVLENGCLRIDLQCLAPFLTFSYIWIHSESWNWLENWSKICRFFLLVDFLQHASAQTNNKVVIDRIRYLWVSVFTSIQTYALPWIGEVI